jgi:hypothetical protein
LGLQETTNDKGRKILVSDDIPFIFTRWEMGKIQSENLKGKTSVTKIDGKSVRGHLFDARTIKQLHSRHAATPVTHDSGIETPKHTFKDSQMEHENARTTSKHQSL